MALRNTGKGEQKFASIALREGEGQDAACATVAGCF
jgi:hypothetical protein